VTHHIVADHYPQLALGLSQVPSTGSCSDLGKNVDSDRRGWSASRIRLGSSDTVVSYDFGLEVALVPLRLSWLACQSRSFRRC
jgi:hypothetical protein